MTRVLQNKKIVYLLMSMLVFLWGFDYIAAKAALATIQPLTLVFTKYFIAILILLPVRLFRKKKFPLKKRDIKILVTCSIFGQLLYFACEYNAMSYLPISIITIILALVPLLSIILEAMIMKKRPGAVIIIGIIISIIGVGMVIDIDISELSSGRWIGYALAFGAVICWNVYNFMTKKLSGKYGTFDLAFMQILCSMLLLLPYAIFNLPTVEQLSPIVVMGMVYLGLINTLVGFFIYIIGIAVIGPTPCALFSNFLPLTAAMFAWIFYGETLSALQLLGGAIVIAASSVVIWQKGKTLHIGIGSDIIDS